MTRSLHHAARTPWLTAALVISATVVAACSGAPAASPAASPTVVPGTLPTAAGPATFADWTARQGFGGSSGVNNVNKLAGWLTEHRYDVEPFDLDSDGGDVISLIAWLDAHPATACWADFHANMRASLAAIAAGYAQAKIDRTTVGAVGQDVAAAMYAESLKAYAMPAPASCP